MYHGYKLYNLG